MGTGSECLASRCRTLWADFHFVNDQYHADSHRRNIARIVTGIAELEWELVYRDDKETVQSHIETRRTKVLELLEAS